MSQNDENIRKRHFSENWLCWVSLRHFLNAPLVRELSYVIVNSMSKGSVDLSQLFEEIIFGEPEGMASWLIQPLETHSELESYLQNRIRTFVWQSDIGSMGILDQVDTEISITASMLDQAVVLGSADLNTAGTIVKGFKEVKQNSFTTMVRAFQVVIDEDFSSVDQKIEFMIKELISSIEMPLAAVILKHFGDLFADADEWNKAKVLYEIADQMFANEETPAWKDLLSSLRSITYQSLATAIMILYGPKKASEYYVNKLSKSTVRTDPVFVANASFDAFVVSAKAVRDFRIPKDNRAAILLPPLVHKTHSAETAIEYSLKGKYQDADQQFWAVLRRQIALGSATESRSTKALYARSLIDEIFNARDRQRLPHLFIMAVKLLIESGNYESTSKINWNEQIINAYVDQECVEQVVAHANAYAGSQHERQMVMITIFRIWSEFINYERIDVVKSMLQHITGLALKPSSLRIGEDLGRQSLEALSIIAKKRPELRYVVASDVANVVSEKIIEFGIWTITQKALETALLYVDVFSNDSVLKVLNSTLSMLDKIDPKSGIWPIIRPAMNLITCESIKGFSKQFKEFGPRIISTVLRFGSESGTENANLMFYLHNFDSALLHDMTITNSLKNISYQLRKRAKAINSSDVINNIMALLLAPAISGPDGIGDAVKGLALILESAKSAHPSLGFSTAYNPLLLISNNQKQIAADISMSADEFILWLKPLIPLLSQVWNLAKEKPLLFTSFSIPPATKPDPIIVHNWAFASIRFSESIKMDDQLKKEIFSAEAHPDLRNSIILARATRSASDEHNTIDTLDIKSIHEENSDAFYAALGRRLAVIRKLDYELARKLCISLLDQIFRLGPREMDAAVLLTANNMKVRGLNKHPNIYDYKKKLDNSRTLRLSLYPLIEMLSDEEIPE